MRDDRIVYTWTDVDVTDEDGEVRRRKAMVPLQRYDNIAGRQFEDGEEYPLVVEEDRSPESHKAYFAQVGLAFKNMPEKLKNAKFPSSEHLRHWALIKTGWCDQSDFVCPDELFLKRMIAFNRKHVPFAMMTSTPLEDGDGNPTGEFVFSVRIAKSQAKSAMKKAEFEASKKAVLDLLSEMIGVSVATLRKEGGRQEYEPYR